MTKVLDCTSLYQQYQQLLLNHLSNLQNSHSIYPECQTCTFLSMFLFILFTQGFCWDQWMTSLSFMRRRSFNTNCLCTRKRRSEQNSYIGWCFMYWVTWTIDPRMKYAAMHLASSTGKPTVQPTAQISYKFINYCAIYLFALGTILSLCICGT